MKNVKVLLAMVALVVTVAVASVSQAADTGILTVSGTLGDVLVMDDCGATASLTALTSSTLSTGSCTAAYEVNNSAGYTMTFANDDTSTFLEGAATPGEIEALVENSTTASNCVIGTECWSYYLSEHSDGTAGVDTGQETASSLTFDDISSCAGGGGTICEHAVPSSASPDPLMSSSAPADDDLTLTFFATVSTTTPADTYSDGGVFTLAAV